MTLPEIVMLCVVLGVGVPSMIKFVGGRLRIRNATAAALVASWSIGQGAWLLTGDNLPLRVYIITDLMVLAVIFTKPEARDCWPYNGLGDQMTALFRERCLADRIVVAIFPLMWTIYVIDISDFARWWTLWALCIAQFLAVGVDEVATWRKGRKAGAKEKPPGAFRLGLAVNV